MTVCDFSSSVPDFRALKTANFEGIITYCTRFNLSQLLVQDALAAGLTVTLVMEAGSQPALRGAAGGGQDAVTANANANAAGYDPHAVIYYVAEDPSRLPQSDWPTVDAYFQAANTVGGRPVGAYGGLALVEHLLSVGLARYGLVVETWGGTSPTVHLSQQIGGVPTQFAGIIDADTILQADYGQMPRPGPTPPPAPTGDFMQYCVFTTPDKNQQHLSVDSKGNLNHRYWVPGQPWTTPEVLATGWDPGTPLTDKLDSAGTIQVWGALAAAATGGEERPAQVYWSGSKWVCLPI